MQNAFRAVSFFALLIFEKKNRIFAAQQCDFNELRRECLMPNGSSSSLSPVQLLEGVAIEMPGISRLAHEEIKKLVPVVSNVEGDFEQAVVSYNMEFASVSRAIG